jgi:YfiH family protein
MPLDLVRSARFAPPHGFTTRSGGVSTGPYASLNLGSHVGDEPAAVEENRARLLAATGATSLAMLDQVHGAQVLEVAPLAPGLLPIGEADASWTQARGVALAIGIADCLPILLHSPDLGAVGAAHAGWRGADLRIGAVLVAALRARGAQPEAMQAVLGPCIRVCCYEVSADLADRFERQFGAGVVNRSRSKPHLDLAEASRLALREAGLAEEHLADVGLCTSCDAVRFFSHRRDHGKTGRMLAFVTLPP